MKKIIIILTVILAIGCSDYIDVVPDNVATIESAFNNRYNAERFLFTCYAYTPDHAGEDRNPALNAGDHIWYNYNISKWGRDMAEGNMAPNSPYFNFWDGFSGGNTRLFVGIRNCNIFLNEIDAVQEVTEQEAIRWKAEAKVLKAYFHFWLTRMYGPIPIVRESLPADATAEEVLVFRDPVDECFDYAVELIDEAIDGLPDEITDENTELGRFTKSVALSLKAKILVTAASPLYNGNSAFEFLTDSRGVKLFPAYDPNKWVLAEAACDSAISFCHSAKIRLYQKDDFRTKHDISDTTLTIATLRSVVSEKWNSELIWGNTNSTINSNMQSKFTPTFFPTTGNPVQQNFAPTLRMAELFYSANGVPIDEDPAYDYAGRFDIKRVPDSLFLLIQPNEKTVGLHMDRELRFYSSLAFDRCAWWGNGSQGGSEATNDHYYIQARQGEVTAPKERSRYSITGYWPRKLVHMDNNMTTSGGYSVIQYAFPVMRLADLYLLYAEALNENDKQAEAQIWVDKIRERAGLEGVVASWQNHSVYSDKPTTKSGLRSIIQQERMIELAFEGHRFWDTRRWKTAGDLMDGKPIRGWSVTDDTPLGGDKAETYYQIKVLATQSFVERDYLWPIRTYEIRVNPNLVQNPGW